MANTSKPNAPPVRGTRHSDWDDAAARYDDGVALSTRLGAARLISMVSDMNPSLTSPHARAIDLGAGTGSLTHQLAALYPSLPILATDFSPAMLDALMNSKARNSTNITTQIVDMADPLRAGGEVREASFTHVFCTMALQVLPEPAKEGTLGKWARLLVEDGIVAIAMGDFDEWCGPHEIWVEAATAVDPTYVAPGVLPPRRWIGRKDLEKGLEEAGFRDVQVESMQIGLNVGGEGFMRFFWESENPMPVTLTASFGGDLERVKKEMWRVLEQRYEGGKVIPLSAVLAVGRKPIS